MPWWVWRHYASLLTRVMEVMVNTTSQMPYCSRAHCCHRHYGMYHVSNAVLVHCCQVKHGEHHCTSRSFSSFSDHHGQRIKKLNPWSHLVSHSFALCLCLSVCRCLSDCLSLSFFLSVFFPPSVSPPLSFFVLLSFPPSLSPPPLSLSLFVCLSLFLFFWIHVSDIWIHVLINFRFYCWGMRRGRVRNWLLQGSLLCWDSNPK